MPGDCCECGACCFSQSNEYVPLSEQDESLLARNKDAISRIQGRAYLRMSEGHCAQLQHLDGEWICNIYNQRPEACRTLQRGSPACLQERHEKKLVVHALSRRLLSDALKK